MALIGKIRQWIIDLLHSGSNQNERPFLKKNNESNIPDLFIIGDLAGAPVIKYAMEQGFDVIEHIATLENAIGGDDPALARPWDADADVQHARHTTQLADTQNDRTRQSWMFYTDLHAVSRNLVHPPVLFGRHPRSE